MISAFIPRLDKLQDRDKEVRAHEQAHFDKAEDLARSGPVITDYVTGEDGTRYADGGHVTIDTSETGNPREDLRRGEILVRSAEAPEEIQSELSDADRKVAAKGRSMIARNRPLVEKLTDLKHRGGALMSPAQLGRVATGMGLNLPSGQLLDLVR